MYGWGCPIGEREDWTQWFIRCLCDLRFKIWIPGKIYGSRCVSSALNNVLVDTGVQNIPGINSVSRILL